MTVKNAKPKTRIDPAVKAIPESISILIEKGEWKRVASVDKLVGEMVLSTLDYLGFSAANGYVVAMTVLLAGDTKIRELNHDFRGKNKPTNILSFPAYSGNIEDHLEAMKQGMYLGDMVLAFETIAYEAKDQSKSLPHHLAHLVVHGTLHLLGFNHETDEEAAMMEDTEIRILAKHRIANPYML